MTNETKYEVKVTSRFKRDYRLAQRRGQNIRLLLDVIPELADGHMLPAENHDHALVGEWIGYRECHIAPDWLLVYRKDEDILVLTLMRTGSHSDLAF